MIGALDTAGIKASMAQPVKTPQAVKNEAEAEKAAQEFEAVFISQFLGAMFEGVKTDGAFGGGPGEGMFRSMMLDNYSKTLTKQGGFGLADSVKREILSMQNGGK
jgi:flagellar protein FlgJ